MDAQIQTMVYDVLQDAIVLLGSLLVGVVTRYIQQHYNAKQIEDAKGIAQIAVSSVEEIANVLGIKGADKLSIALNKARALAIKAGIELTDDQWHSLIHDALAELKGTWRSRL